MAKSELSKERQIELSGLFSLADDAELAEVAALFEEHPEWIVTLYKNYQEKRRAVQTGDRELWRRIIQDEKKELEVMEKKE